MNRLTIVSVISLFGMAVPALSQKYELRFSNIDDSLTATISNSAVASQQLLQAGYSMDTGFVDISSFVRSGANVIHIALYNGGGGYTYGYEFRVDGVIKDSSFCGTSGIIGCNNDDQNHQFQITYTHDISFDVPDASMPKQPNGKPVVRIVYLVPADRGVNGAYSQQIERTIRNLQIWYRNEIGTGATFQLYTPVVEAHTTPHQSDWYATAPNGASREYYFWLNTLQDGFSLTGGRPSDPENRWIFYIDADVENGQIIGGNDGVAVLARNDLVGLAGTTPCRWVGGLGHELGHSFGLAHPPSCPGSSCPENALMWLGYSTYPNAYLLPSDKSTLSSSPFFFQVEDVPTVLPSCYGVGLQQTIVSFTYPGGGSFTRNGNNWVEKGTDGTLYTFIEQNRDVEYIYILDQSRGMEVRLPLAGGMSSWRTNGGAWIDLYAVTPQFASA